MGISQTSDQNMKKVKARTSASRQNPCEVFVAANTGRGMRMYGFSISLPFVRTGELLPGPENLIADADGLFHVVLVVAIIGQ